jgi:hypothetical protein
MEIQFDTSFFRDHCRDGPTMNMRSWLIVSVLVAAVCVSVISAAAFRYAAEADAVAIVVTTSTITSTIYATILLWDRLSDRPHLKVDSKDIRIVKYKAEEYFRLDIGLRNEGRQDAEIVRASAKIKTCNNSSIVTIERLRWGRHMEPDSHLKQEYLLRSNDSAYMQLSWQDVVGRSNMMREPGAYRVVIQATSSGSNLALATFLLKVPEDTLKLSGYEFTLLSRIIKKKFLFRQVLLTEERLTNFLDQEVESCARAYFKD